MKKIFVFALVMLFLTAGTAAAERTEILGRLFPDFTVTVNFCTDTSCTMRKSDESGTTTFDDIPGKYHVKMLKVPDGNSFDRDFDFIPTISTANGRCASVKNDYLPKQPEDNQV